MENFVDLTPLNEARYDEDEIEVMFNNYNANKLSLGSFVRVCEYLRANYKKRESSVQLDVVYGKNMNERYRAEVREPNAVMAPLMNKKNYIVFMTLLSKKDKNVVVVKKTRKFVQDFDEVDVRLRISEERDVAPEEMKELMALRESAMYQIRFRLKSRMSVVLFENKEVRVVADVTHTQTHMDARHVANAPSSYEFEVEIQKKKSKVKLDPIYEQLTLFRNLIDNTRHIYPRSHRLAVLDTCFELFNGTAETKRLSLMQPVSLELIHLIEKIQMGYSVTDKADGERYVMIVVQNEAFLIDTKMEVKKIADLPDKKWHLSVFDGEYIEHENKRYFLLFDVMFDKGIDLRINDNLLERLESATAFVAHYFGMKYKVTIVDDVAADMKRYYDEWRKYEGVIWVKYFHIPKGVAVNEVYQSMVTMEREYKRYELYERDGFILTPLKQEYTNSAEKLKNPVYKWKPSQFNSLDLYVEFEKNEKTGKIENYYDKTMQVKSEEEEKKDEDAVVVFRKCYLYVGRTTGTEEHPVPFNVARYCLLRVDENNLVRDLNGNVVVDKTVVEFSYDNDPLLMMEHRWVPMRTRYDKTQVVQQYKRKYGNNEKVVMKIWNSINERIDMDTIAQLATNYDATVAQLRTRIDRFKIAEEAEKQAYYQKQSNLAKSARQFNNFIKTFLCQNYCSPAPRNGTMVRKSVVDFGVGRGGDILRMYNSKVASYVGVDRDMNGIISPQDGCISRYTQMKNSKKYPNFPEMVFFNADVGASFEVDAQLQVLATKSAENTRKIKKFLNTKYDVINSQFMIHYLFKDEETLQTLCENVNRVLKSGGYMVVTTYDGKMIHELLQRHDGTATSHYVDTDGQEKKFMEIKQLYDATSDIQRTGLAISYFNASFMDEGDSYVEYLVEPDFFVRTMAERCDMVCVETDSFEGVFDRFKDFFKSAVTFESIDETRKYLGNVAQYFDEKSALNNRSYDFVKTYRYFVFMKN